MDLAMARGEEVAPEEAWSCVLTTSRGDVIVLETVPAKPPENKFRSWALETRGAVLGWLVDRALVERRTRSRRRERNMLCIGRLGCTGELEAGKNDEGVKGAQGAPTLAHMAHTASTSIQDAWQAPLPLHSYV